MRIVVKEIDRHVSKTNDNVLSEYLIYLIDNNDNNLSCELVYGLKNKTKMLVDMMHKNGLKTFTEISYEEFLSNQNV